MHKRCCVSAAAALVKRQAATVENSAGSPEQPPANSGHGLTLEVHFCVHCRSNNVQPPLLVLQGRTAATRTASEWATASVGWSAKPPARGHGCAGQDRGAAGSQQEPRPHLEEQVLGHYPLHTRQRRSLCERKQRSEPGSDGGSQRRRQRAGGAAVAHLPMTAASGPDDPSSSKQRNGRREGELCGERRMFAAAIAARSPRAASGPSPSPAPRRSAPPRAHGFRALCLAAAACPAALADPAPP